MPNSGDADHAGEHRNPHRVTHLEPAPLDITSGTTPMMKAIDVIRIGRSRKRLASIAACTGVRPANSSSRANSTIRMAFFGRQPHQHDQTDLGEHVVVALGQPDAEPCAASKPIGTIMMIDSGSVRLSYSAASTRNTSSSATGNTTSAELPAMIS